MESSDKPDEKFLMVGEDLPELMLPILEGARFVERLHRGNIPFIILWIDEYELTNAHRMCRNIYEPHIDDYAETIEHPNARFTLLNMKALNELPVNPFVEVIDPEQIWDWNNNYNLYLFVATLENRDDYQTQE